MNLTEFHEVSAARMRLYSLAKGDRAHLSPADLREVCAGFVKDARPQDGILLEAALARVAEGRAPLDPCCVTLHAELARTSCEAGRAERDRRDLVHERLKVYMKRAPALGPGVRWQVLMRASELLQEPLHGEALTSARRRWSEWARRLFEVGDPDPAYPTWSGFSPEPTELALTAVPEASRKTLACRLLQRWTETPETSMSARSLALLRRLRQCAHQAWTSRDVRAAPGASPGRTEKEEGDDGRRGH